jgi:transposase
MAIFEIKTSSDPTTHRTPQEEVIKMARYKIDDSTQGKFIPVSFQDQIQPGTFEFTLSYLIDHKVDLTVFEELYCNDETGAPAYNPAMLLKIILLGYSRSIISSRAIAKACEENIVFMALSGDRRPHFTTIANFITKMDGQVRSIFADVLLYCDQIGLIGRNMFAIDGCKLPSNASKEWSGTHKSLKRKKQKMQQAVKVILEKHRHSDEKETDKNLKDREKHYIETINSRIKKIENFLKTTEDKIGKTGKEINSNITDNESAKMKTSHGVIQGYDGVVAVDDKTQVIVHAEAFGQAQEHDLLKPMIEGTRENFKTIGQKGDVFKQAQMTADAGFHSEPNMKMLADEGIDGYVADNRFRKRDPKFAETDKYKERTRKEMARISGSRCTFGVKEFQFPDDLSYCICPAGKRLYRSGGNTFTKGKHAVRFKGPKSSCCPCHLRSKCLRYPERTETRTVAYFTGKTKGARITFSQRMKEKIDSDRGRAIYSKRIGTVEPVFANLRHILKFDRFTLRSKLKVNIQWNMLAVLHNMLKIQRFGPQFT